MKKILLILTDFIEFVPTSKKMPNYRQKILSFFNFLGKIENNFFVFLEKYNQNIYTFFAFILGTFWTILLYNTLTWAILGFILSFILLKLKEFYLIICDTIWVKIPLFFLLFIAMVTCGLVYKAKFTVKELLKIIWSEIKNLWNINYN